MGIELASCLVYELSAMLNQTNGIYGGGTFIQVFDQNLSVVDFTDLEASAEPSSEGYAEWWASNKVPMSLSSSI